MQIIFDRITFLNSEVFHYSVQKTSLGLSVQMSFRREFIQLSAAHFLVNDSAKCGYVLSYSLVS